MTTYTAIANSEIDTDSPVTESLMTKMRDNPIAITEGASGAPNIQTAAIADAAVTLVKMSDAVSAAATELAMWHPKENSATTTAYTKIKEVIALCSGSFYSTFSLRSSTVAALAYARVYVNGVAVGTEHSTTSTTGVPKTDASLSVSKGDRVQIYVKHQSSSQTSYVQQWAIYVAATNGAVFNYSEV